MRQDSKTFSSLFQRKILEFFAVGVENARGRDEAYIAPLAGHHRKVPGPGLFELQHHALHRLIFIDVLRGAAHIVIDMIFVVQV